MNTPSLCSIAGLQVRIDSSDQILECRERILLRRGDKILLASYGRIVECENDLPSELEQEVAVALNRHCLHVDQHRYEFFSQAASLYLKQDRRLAAPAGSAQNEKPSFFPAHDLALGIGKIILAAEEHILVFNGIADNVWIWNGRKRVMGAVIHDTQ
ncbi:MAG: hypothetical protein HY770_00445 [Chitinivibrionia bacterium]|nr:hypothetical protein [Chitinivibrionia bacterium]